MTNRRQFLISTSLAALVKGAPAAAIPPISRTGSAKFKFSMAAYSYRDLLSGNAPPLTLFDFVSDCARFGLDGTELTSYYFPKDFDVEYLRSLKKRCFELGLDITGTAVGNDFGIVDKTKLREQIANVKRWVDHAEVLGAPVIRIFAGQIPTGEKPDIILRQMISAMEECCDYAGQHGVYLALENHGGPTDTANGLLRFVEAVKSPWFGVNVDTGNFHGDDLYGELRQIAPYAVNVQVKVVVSGPAGKKEPADFGRVADILGGVGYRGYIVLEYEESGDPRQECPKYLNELRVAFRSS